MRLLGAPVAGLWLIVLIVFCLLMAVGTALLLLSNGLLWGAYRLRDGMEVLGNKVEAASR